MKRFLLPFLLCFTCIQLYSQSSNWSVKFSDAILSRYSPTINAMTGKGWEYSNGIVVHGMEKVYLQTGDIRYLNYIKAYVDTYINDNGNVLGLARTLDKIQPGMLCLFLYQETGLTKYKTAATNIRNYLIGPGSLFAKTPDGGYWHKNDASYNNVMMLDGIYMAHPFLAKYGSMFDDTACLDVAAFQTLLLASHTYDSENHLAKHAWHYDKSRPWANPVTGASGETWSRGLGWYAMGIVDILRYLPATHPEYAEMRTLLSNLAIGIKNTQDTATGLWYQVMDKADSAGNYIETSGSGMFIYALRTAVNSGWIDSSYITVAEKGWTGLQKYFFTHTDGMPGISSFAPAMSVQNNYQAYVDTPPVNCPAPFPAKQHPHGYCAVLMAAALMETAERSSCPGADVLFISGYKGSYTYQWQMNNGPGYEDITDNGVYTGTQTDSLKLQNPATSLYGTKYRCVISSADHTVHSNEYVLKFVAKWVGTLNNAWEDGVNWSCGIVPDANTDIIIPSGAENYPVISFDTSCRSIKVAPGASVNIQSGVTLTLTGKQD